MGGSTEDAFLGAWDPHGKMAMRPDADEPAAGAKRTGDGARAGPEPSDRAATMLSHAEDALAKLQNRATLH